MTRMDPSTPMPFVKMHGLGNDFMILETTGGAPRLSAGQIRALADRQRGVGFDQLVEVRRTADAPELTFWNADGTPSGACGNATRCVAARLLPPDPGATMTLLTRRGALSACRGQDGRVSVNLGTPLLDWAGIPLARPCDPQRLPLEGSPSAVGMGNPHCVFFLPDAEAVDLAALGPRVETDTLFPERTNVEIASLVGADRLRLRVWERGAGITLACGSGACATAVAAHLRGLTGRRVTLDLDGGALEVDWRDDGVWLSGPTAHVYDGIVTRAALEAAS